MIEARRDITTTLFILPPDAKFLPVSELAPRLRPRIGVVEEGQSVITRPGFRMTTRLVPRPLAELLAEFQSPSLLTDAVLRFARTHEQDPFDTLELAFDALATLVEARILVPQDSPDARAPTPSLAAGQEFAGFEIDVLVRSLEDSEVYRAHTPEGEDAALKVARDDRPGITAMLAHEARVLERLAGLDAPRLLADGVTRGRAYVAMEWCDGTSIAVAAQQARAARDRRRLQDIVGGMLEAYARLHHRGVLHGDVHPGNCLVSDSGRIVILDFGNARPIDSATTVDPARAGIPQFYDPQMAEALLAGRLPPAVTPASEQYAISVLAYLLVTGQQPIEAPAVHDELSRRIVQRPPLPFAARGVSSWPGVEAALGRGLAKAPADRFSHVESLARSFLSADIPPLVAPALPARARCAFDTEIEAVRSLAPSVEPLEHAWFALRAALALQDAELLAAADVLVHRGGSGWAAQAVCALVARARSDLRMENGAIGAFLASVERRLEGRAASRAVVAAAAMLEGAASRAVDRSALAGWASRTVDRILARPPIARKRDAAVVDPLPTYAALLLARTSVLAVRADLAARLATHVETNTGGVWLWSLAYDVLADDRFRQQALAAPLPRRPRKRALTLLRLHQLTGDTRFVTEASRVLEMAPRVGLPAADTALVAAELMAPELATLPPFECPFQSLRPRREGR